MVIGKMSLESLISDFKIHFSGSFWSFRIFHRPLIMILFYLGEGFHSFGFEGLGGRSSVNSFLISHFIGCFLLFFHLSSFIKDFHSFSHFIFRRSIRWLGLFSHGFGGNVGGKLSEWNKFLCQLLLLFISENRSLLVSEFFRFREGSLGLKERTALGGFGKVGFKIFFVLEITFFEVITANWHQKFIEFKHFNNIRSRKLRFLFIIIKGNNCFFFNTGIINMLFFYLLN